MYTHKAVIYSITAFWSHRKFNVPMNYTSSYTTRATDTFFLSQAQNCKQWRSNLLHKSMRNLIWLFFLRLWLRNGPHDDILILPTTNSATVLLLVLFTSKTFPLWVRGYFNTIRRRINTFNPSRCYGLFTRFDYFGGWLQLHKRTRNTVHQIRWSSVYQGTGNTKSFYSCHMILTLAMKWLWSSRNSINQYYWTSFPTRKVQNLAMSSFHIYPGLPSSKVTYIESFLYSTAEIYDLNPDRCTKSGAVMDSFSMCL